MKVTIYGGYKSWTRDSRPRWLLEEAGLPYTLIQLDVFAGEQRQPEYLAINPLGKVPFLVDGDVRIAESGAILAHLADRYAPHLIPAVGTAERAEVYHWLQYSAAMLETPVVKVFVNRYLFPNTEGADEAALQGLNELAVHARLLTDRLAARDYLVGGSFSIADIMIGTTLVWAQKGGALSDYPVLSAYLERLGKRAAFRQAMAPTAKEFDGYPS